MRARSFGGLGVPLQQELDSKSPACPTRPTWPLPTFLTSSSTNTLVCYTSATLTSMSLSHAELIHTSRPLHFLFPLPVLHFPPDSEGLAPYDISIFIVFIIPQVFTGLSIQITNFLQVQPHLIPLLNSLLSIFLFLSGVPVLLLSPLLDVLPQESRRLSLFFNAASPVSTTETNKCRCLYTVTDLIN